MKITFSKPDGNTAWFICEALEYNSLDGYMMDCVKETSYHRGPSSGAATPPDWQIVSVQEV